MNTHFINLFLKPIYSSKDDADDVSLNPTSGLLDEKFVLLGNKLLVYVSCCLAGRAYPMGDIPDELVPKVKDDIFHFLVTPNSKKNARGMVSLIQRNVHLSDQRSMVMKKRAYSSNFIHEHLFLRRQLTVTKIQFIHS